jgi:signal transduction histidine kinase
VVVAEVAVTTGRQRPNAVPGVCLLALVALLGLTLVAWPRSGVSHHILVDDALVISNAVLGACLGLSGYPVARARPDHPVGWLLLTSGLCYTASACGFVTMAWLTDPGEQGVGWRIVAFVTSIGWAAVVGLLMPAALLVFPDGRLLPGAAWRAGSAVALAAGALFAVRESTAPAHLGSQLHVANLVTWPAATNLGGLGVIGDVLFGCIYPFTVLVLVIRYRRGVDRERRQVLWILLGTLLMTVCFAIGAAFFPETWIGIYPIALVPAAIAIAIVREDLFDIRRATARAALYLALTGLAIATYAAVVAGTTAALSPRMPFGSAVIAALTVAIGFNPARIFLQRRIDRLLYGRRTDPAHAVARIVGRLEDPRLDAVLGAVCETLRLPWAEITADHRVLACSGQPTPTAHLMSLGDGGVLRVGLRSGEAQLGPRDLEILTPVAHSLAVAVRAERTASDLLTARSELITAREEERRRLGRELHDGVGSALAAVILTADAARRQDPTDPRTGDLLADLGRQTRDVADEVRRLARDLRPPILDSLGLEGALREYANLLSPLDVSVAVIDLPRLPAAVEVAAYRIVTEALTNVVRHAQATHARVVLPRDSASMTILVEDDGPGRGIWIPGVGLTSMAERAAELGGSLSAGPRADQPGGRVEAHLPWADSP